MIRKKKKKIKRRGAVAITLANNERKAPPAVKIARTASLPFLTCLFVRFIAEGLKKKQERQQDKGNGRGCIRSMILMEGVCATEREVG